MTGSQSAVVTVTRTSSSAPGYLRVDVPFTAEERLAFKRFLDSHGLKGGKWIRSLIVKALRAEGAAPGGTP